MVTIHSPSLVTFQKELIYKDDQLASSFVFLTGAVIL